MNYLSLDYGLSTIGLAIAKSPLAEPYGQIKNKSFEQVLSSLQSICEQESIDRIIIGISEGEMLKKTRDFINFLNRHLTQKIIEYDETLTSYLAKDLLISSGAKKKKRQQKDHQIAATIILQNYLDKA